MMFGQPLGRLLIAGLIVLVIAGGAVSFTIYSQQKKKSFSKLETATTETTTPTTSPTTTSPTGQESPSSTGSSSTSTTPAQTTTTTQTRTIDQSATKLTKISTKNCYAYAPSNWVNVESMQAVGFGYDAYNADQTSMASYGMVGIPSEAVYFYGYTSAEVFIEKSYSSLGYTGFSWQGEAVDVGGGYKTRVFQAAAPNGQSVTAMDLYKTWDIGGGGFIVGQRVGTTLTDKWKDNSALTFNIALSMRCTAQLQQSSGTSSSSSNDEVSDMITSSYEKRSASQDRLSNDWSEAMLGHENVYSPSTGEHYQAPLSSKWETGPDGPGYYRATDSVGGVEKLERGFGY